MSKMRKDFTDFIGDTSRKHWVAESMMEADEYNRRNRDDSSFSFYDDLDEFGEDRNADFGFSDDYDDDFDDSDDDYGFSQDDDRGTG